MVLKNTNDVKRWLRSISLVKKELSLRISFYRDLVEDFMGDKKFKRSTEYYKSQIAELEHKLKVLTADTERLFDLLDESEKLVITARYLKLVKWDYIEFQVFYSRRQSVRIHERAVLKLVGQTVGDEALYEF